MAASCIVSDGGPLGTSEMEGVGAPDEVGAILGDADIEGRWLVLGDTDGKLEALKVGEALWLRASDGLADAVAVGFKLSLGGDD